MYTLNISSGTKVQVLANGKKEIEALLKGPKPKNMTLYIVMSYSTNVYEEEILEVIGEWYKPHITIVSDDRLEFGEISIEAYSLFYEGSEKNRRNKVKLLDYVPQYNLDELNEKINMENPTYLVMSKGTWVGLCNASPENTDDYHMNDKAYYHSYRKVVVALTEFLEYGRIDVIV